MLAKRRFESRFVKTSRCLEVKRAAPGKRFKIEVLTDAETAINVQREMSDPHRIDIHGAAGTRVGHTGTPTANRSARTLEEQARLVGAGRITGDEINGVMKRHHVEKELKLDSVEGRLAIGVVLVQGLGLYQWMKKLDEEFGKLYQNDEALFEALLTALDSAGGPYARPPAIRGRQSPPRPHPGPEESTCSSPP